MLGVELPIAADDLRSRECRYSRLDTSGHSPERQRPM